MELLKDWIQQLILIILFVVVVEMLLPSSEWKRYTKVVFSLIIFLTLLQPVLSLFKVDTNQLLLSSTAIILFILGKMITISEKRKGSKSFAPDIGAVIGLFIVLVFRLI